MMAIAGPTNNHDEIRMWAESRSAVPVEVLPLVVDSIPALLQIMLKEQAKDHPNVLVIGWEEFFCKFDALGLTFVYDDAATGYNEILQKEELSPYRHPEYRAASLAN
jgi:hypothetical protein